MSEYALLSTKEIDMRTDTAHLKAVHQDGRIKKYCDWKTLV